MIEINIKLEEKARILEAFGVESSEQIRERLIDYLNTVVNDYEQNIEVSRAIAAYSFTPLTEIVDEPIEGPEDPPVEDLIEDPEEPPIEDPPVE